MPRVSVLVPVRNGEPFLEAALSDLARQTYRDLEIVIVDDGSTDATPHRLERFCAEAPRQRRWLRQAPLGVVVAANRATREAGGEILVRMDADDRCHPDRVRRQVAFLDAHPAVAVCGTQIHVFPRRIVTEGMQRYERWQNGLLDPVDLVRDLLVEAPLCQPSVAMRRGPLESVGGYREGAFPEDYDLWLRLDAAGYALGKVPGKLTLWREHPRRQTRRNPDLGPAGFREVKLRYLLRPGGPISGGAAVVWGAGQEGKPWLRALAARGVAVERVVDLDPRKLGQRIHGARVVAPEDLAPPDETRPVLVAVGARGARAEIRAWLTARRYVERRDFYCVA